MRRFLAMFSLAGCLVATAPAAHAQECDVQAIDRSLAESVMPDLTHCREDIAVRFLRARRLAPTVKQGRSYKVQPGTVYLQSPDPNVALTPSIQPTIWVSGGPEGEDTFSDAAVQGAAGEGSTPIVGEAHRFNFQLVNAGTAPIDRIVLTVGSENLDNVSVSGDCSEFPCEIQGLASGSIVQLPIMATAHSAGSFKIGVSARASSDINKDNNQSRLDGLAVDSGQGPTGTDVSLPQADVAVSAVFRGGAPTKAGVDTTVDLVVENKGPQSATEVVLRADTKDLADVSVSGPCSVLPCVVGELPSGGSSKVTLRGRTRGGALLIQLRANGATADPRPGNNAVSLESNIEDTKGVLRATAESLDERWVRGKGLHFRIRIWNDGGGDLRDIRVRLGKTLNLGALTLPGGCASNECTIASLGAGETHAIDGMFETPAKGEARFTFPITSGAGRATQTTEVGFAGMVGTGWPPWIWIPIAICGIGLTWGVAKLLLRPPIPDPIVTPVSAPAPAPAVPPAAPTRPSQTPQPSAPNVRVDPVSADTLDARPTTDIELTAPPLRIEVALAEGDAYVDADLHAWRKEH